MPAGVIIGAGDTLGALAAVVAAHGGWIVPIMAVFARMSMFLFLLPGLGETSIPVRVRLGAALMLTWLLVPILAPQIMPLDSAAPLSVAGSFLLILRESAFGLFMGLAFRILVFTLQIMGNIVSQALSISQVLGEGIATEPNTTLSTTFMLAGVALLVTMNLHVEAVGTLAASYDLFPLGSSFDTEMSAHWLMQKTASGFTLGVTLALPFVLLNFIYNLIIGFVNRAMPQLMVSFVGMPAITGAGLVMLALASTMMLSHWAREYGRIFDVFGAGAP